MDFDKINDLISMKEEAEEYKTVLEELNNELETMNMRLTLVIEDEEKAEIEEKKADLEKAISETQSIYEEEKEKVEQEIEKFKQQQEKEYTDIEKRSITLEEYKILEKEKADKEKEISECNKMIESIKEQIIREMEEEKGYEQNTTELANERDNIVAFKSYLEEQLSDLNDKISNSIVTTPEKQKNIQNKKNRLSSLKYSNIEQWKENEINIDLKDISEKEYEVNIEERKPKEAQKLLANDLMEDLLKIQQTSNLADFSKLVNELKEKYKNASDTWLERLNTSANKQYYIIKEKEDNTRKEKSESPKGKEASYRAEDLATGDGKGETIAEKAPDVEVQKDSNGRVAIKVYTPEKGFKFYDAKTGDEVYRDIDINTGGLTFIDKEKSSEEETHSHKGNDLSEENKHDDFEAIESIFNGRKGKNPTRENTDYEPKENATHIVGGSFATPKEEEKINPEKTEHDKAGESKKTATARKTTSETVNYTPEEQKSSNNEEKEQVHRFEMLPYSKDMFITYKNSPKRYIDHKPIDYTQEFKDSDEIYKIIRDCDKRLGIKDYSIHEKFDPNILKVLKETNPNQIDDYVKAVMNQEKMPFLLKYDLNNKDHLEERW